MKNVLSISTLNILLFSTVTPYADIIDRGNGLIYDSDQDLTWTQNADINGKMPQQTAVEWAETLVYQGFDDWRLPSTTRYDDLTCTEDVRADTNYGSVIFYERRADCLGGEMELLTATADPYRNPLFENVQAIRYWTATPYRDGIDPCAERGTCTTPTDNGVRKDFYWQWSFERVHKTTLRGGNPRYAWPVRDGDVVPEDSSGVLTAALNIHSPSLNFQNGSETLNLWAKLEYLDSDPNELIWQLTDFGVNKTPFTGLMTGQVKDDLEIHIPSIVYQTTSFRVTLEYLHFDDRKGFHLWKLKDYGVNE